MKQYFKNLFRSMKEILEKIIKMLEEIIKVGGVGGIIGYFIFLFYYL